MEDIRPDNEDDEKNDLSTSKKKRADKVSLFSFDFKIEKPKKGTAQKREDLLSLLTRKTVEVENNQEDSEAEVLSAIEEKQIAKQIVFDHQAEYHDLVETETNTESLEALEALDIFHDKILNEDLDSTQALAETLAEINNSDEYQPETSEVIDLRKPTEKLDLTEEPVAIRPSYLEFKANDKKEVSDNQPNSSTAQRIFDRVPILAVPSKQPEAKRSKAGNTFNEIIDSLLVKRQDRIKSDQNRVQVKKTIEQQVTKIRAEIITKELTVRQAAIEKNKSRPGLMQESPSRAPALEANRLHSTVAPEKIGKVLLTVTETTNTIPRVEMATLQPIDQHIETISRADLLELSAKTLVDGSTLRQAYETNLITEKGLRRILIEHLRGGDVKRALRRELVERDMDFERDPELRDKSRSQSGNNSINNLIMKVAPEIIDYENKPPITIKSHISVTARNKPNKKGRTSWLDIGLVLVITVLLSLVLMLVMNR